MKVLCYGLAALFLGVTPFLMGAGCSTTVGASGAGDVAVGDACTDDTECDPGDACDPQSGVCIVASDLGDVGPGAACEDDGDCDSGLVCDDQGLCDTDPDASGGGQTGDPCQQDSDCTDGSECDIDTDTCM